MGWQVRSVVLAGQSHMQLHVAPTRKTRPQVPGNDGLEGFAERRLVEHGFRTGVNHLLTNSRVICPVGDQAPANQRTYDPVRAVLTVMPTFWVGAML